MEDSKVKSLLILMALITVTIFAMFAVDTFVFTAMTYYSIAYWVCILVLEFIYIKIFYRDILTKIDDYVILFISSIVVFFISPPIHEVLYLFGGK